MFCVCWFASCCWKNNNFVEDSVDEIIIFILLVAPMAFPFEFGDVCLFFYREWQFSWDHSF